MFTRLYRFLTRRDYQRGYMQGYLDGKLAGEASVRGQYVATRSKLDEAYRWGWRDALLAESEATRDGSQGITKAVSLELGG